MKLQLSINKKKRVLFENMLSKILPLSYQVDVMSNHIGMKSKYEIPYENDNQRRTIISISRAMR